MAISPPWIDRGEQSRLTPALREVRRIQRSRTIQGRLPVRGKPFPHQRKAYAIGTTLDAAALLMEQRTGKTLAAIAIAGQRHRLKQVTKLLIGAPLSVTDVWEEQFNEHADFKYKLRIVSAKDIYGCGRAGIQNLFGGEDRFQILVINYEALWRVVAQIKRWKPDMAILDESQRIKHRSSKQSRACHRLGRVMRHKLILTGTPITQSPIDVFSQYLFLNPAIFGTRYKDFERRYVIKGGYMNHQVVGYRRLKKLSSRAHSIAYRVTRKEVFKDCPKEVDQKLRTDLKESAKAYRQLEKHMVTVVKGERVSTPLVITQIMRLQQIAGGFLNIGEDGEKKIIQVGAEKLRLLREYLEDFPRTKKVVIFARFIPEIKAICRLLTELGIKHVSLTGANKKKGERRAIRRRFDDPRGARAIVVQDQVGGAGLDFSVASTAVYYSKSRSATVYDQTRARLLGPKQREPVAYVHLIVRGTIDELIYRAHMEKLNLARLVIDTFNPNKWKGDIMAKKTSKSSAPSEVKEAKKTEEPIDIQAVVSKLERETSDHQPKSKHEESHVSKKEKKSKSEKPSKKESVNNVSLADICKSLKVDGTEVRKALRNSKIKKPGGSWTWPKGHEDIAKVEKLAKSLGK